MLHQVGVGALGPVFRTYEPTRDRLVAVKVFRLDVTPEQAQALADELTVAADAGLFHPSVVEPIAAGVEGTVAYRAEEYVAAETLDVALRHYAPAPIDKVLPLITQLAGAIDFARTAGVGHGALHPRDIFVTPEEARATGFGVVEALERVGLRAPVRRPYSAPERVSGGAWNTAADVFSLAAIAYELLTGRRPAGTGSQIGSVSGTSAGAHPGALHAVFVQAMDDDPARRHQTALGFASALDAAARGEAPAISYERGGAGAAVASTAVARALPSRVPASDRLRDDLETGGAVDDIAAEREEDEAHFALLRDEGGQSDDVEIAGGGRSLFDDEALEDLALDAPAAVETERFANEFGLAVTERPDDPDAGGVEAEFDRRDGVDQDFDDEEVVDDDEVPVKVEEDEEIAPLRSVGGTAYTSGPAGVAGLGDLDVDPRAAASYDTPAIEHPIQERPRSLMMPVAIALMLGLLIGGIAAYAWLMRGPAIAEPADESSSVAATSSEPVQPYSEGSIGSQQAPASGNAAGTPPVATAPPPVVEERPSPETPPAPAPEKPTAKTGRVVVNSTPRGAGVTVGGRWRGRTPLTLDEMPFGSHNIRVVQPGFTPQNERVTLSAGTPSRTLSFRLQRTAPARPAPARPATTTPQTFTGSIYVDSRPRGARVLLDGKEIGTTPMRIPDVRIGSHIIKLQLEDHSDWTSSTRVVSGQESRVTGSLERIR